MDYRHRESRCSLNFRNYGSPLRRYVSLWLVPSSPCCRRNPSSAPHATCTYEHGFPSCVNSLRYPTTARCYEWDKREKEKKEKKEVINEILYLFQCRVCRGDGAGFKHRLSMVRWWAKESMSSVTFNIFIITTASVRRQEEHTYLFYIVRRSLNFAKEEIFAQESESCLTTRIELLLHGNLARIVEEKKWL